MSYRPIRPQSGAAGLLLTLSLILLARPAVSQTPAVKITPFDVAPSLSDVSFRAAPLLLVHRSGCLVMVDADAKQLVCIQPKSGASVHQGAKGSGPAEYLDLRSVVSTEAGGVAVYDPASARVTVLRPDWTVGATVRVVSGLEQLIHVAGDTITAIRAVRPWEVGSIDARSGAFLGRFSPAPADSSNLFEDPRSGDWSAWAVSGAGGRILIASAWRYRASIYDAHGHQVGVLQRIVPPELPSKAEVAQRKALMLKMNIGLPAEKQGRLLQLVDEYSRTAKPFAPAAPAVDKQGRVWVVTPRVRADSTEIDVFASSGPFLSTVRVPGTVEAIAFGDGQLYVLGEQIGGTRDGEQGVEAFHVH